MIYGYALFEAAATSGMASVFGKVLKIDTMKANAMFSAGVVLVTILFNKVIDLKNGIGFCDTGAYRLGINYRKRPFTHINNKIMQLVSPVSVAFAVNRIRGVTAERCAALIGVYYMSRVIFQIVYDLFKSDKPRTEKPKSE